MSGIDLAKRKWPQNLRECVGRLPLGHSARIEYSNWISRERELEADMAELQAEIECLRAALQQRWIPVTERLPEVLESPHGWPMSDSVLVTDALFGEVSEASWDGSAWHFEGETYERTPREVIGWCPKPEAMKA